MGWEREVRVGDADCQSWREQSIYLSFISSSVGDKPIQCILLVRCSISSVLPSKNRSRMFVRAHRPYIRSHLLWNLLFKLARLLGPARLEHVIIRSWLSIH